MCHSTTLTVVCTTDCLSQHNYNEEKCAVVIDALYECCNEFYKRKGDDATTTACPKPSLLRLKIKQRSGKK